MAERDVSQCLPPSLPPWLLLHSHASGIIELPQDEPEFLPSFLPALASMEGEGGRGEVPEATQRYLFFAKIPDDATHMNEEGGREGGREHL